MTGQVAVGGDHSTCSVHALPDKDFALTVVRAARSGRNVQMCPACLKRFRKSDREVKREWLAARKRPEPVAVALGEVLTKKVPEGLGFMLLVFDTKNGERAASLSSATPAETIAVVREWLASVEERS